MDDDVTRGPRGESAVTRAREQVRDEWLVLAARGGDVAAFESLIHRWRPVMTRHAWRLTGDADGAADVTQESCLAVVRGLGRLHDPATFGVWVLRIVSNKAADWVRRRERERRRQPPATSATPDTLPDLGSRRQTAPDDRTALIRQAVKRLPVHLRSVVGLYYAEGLSVAETAAALGVPPGTIKSRLHEARQRLKDTLEGRQHELVR